MRHELFIEGMGCDHCVRAVDAALKKIEGVETVTVELGHAIVEAKESVDPALLRVAVESEGYRLRA